MKRPIKFSPQQSVFAQVFVLLAGLSVLGVPGFTKPNRALQSAIQPGQPWLDTNGVHINAHGFSVLDVDGRYYWYGAHKIEGKTEDEKNEAGVRLYVSDDLINWEDKGLVLSALAPDAHPELAEAFILDRPKVVFNKATKKFVMYFKLYPPKEKGGESGKDYAWVGVATSDTPTGPFAYRGYFLGNHTKFGTGDFAIFTDSDGATYHIAVRKPDKALVYGRLSEDGLKPVGDYKVLEGVTLKTEAPALFRRGDKVYLLGSGTSGWKPNPARMFVADQFAGPYRELPNPCRGVNPHNNLGPDKTFGGQSTFVYPLAGRQDAWIAMFDINKPEDPINAGYIWLPIEFEADQPVIRWRDAWDLSVFSAPAARAEVPFELHVYEKGGHGLGLPAAGKSAPLGMPSFCAGSKRGGFCLEPEDTPAMRRLNRPTLQ